MLTVAAASGWEPYAQFVARSFPGVFRLYSNSSSNRTSADSSAQEHPGEEEGSGPGTEGSGEAVGTLDLANLPLHWRHVDLWISDIYDTGAILTPGALEALELLVLRCVVRRHLLSMS